MSVKIVIFAVEEWEKPFFLKGLADQEVLFDSGTVSKEIRDEYKSAEVISIRSLPALDVTLLAQFSNLKLICTRTTGFDHIDLDYCRDHNITVCNVPDYGAHTVAEQTMALMLAISRKIVPSVLRTRQGDFRLDGLRGFELYGKTLGVIGVGSIGRAVIRIARCFGMNVITYTKHPDQKIADEMGFHFVQLPELLSSSDIISLHVPYNKSTHHLINKNNIQEVKKGSILINTARGGVVETEALLIGLDNKILSAVGLDVLEEECYISDETELMTEQFLKECNLKTQLLNHVLLKRENVIITPHNAFNSSEALERIIAVTIQNITAFLQQAPQNMVQ